MLKGQKAKGDPTQTLKGQGRGATGEKDRLDRTLIKRRVSSSESDEILASRAKESVQ